MSDSRNSFVTMEISMTGMIRSFFAHVLPQVMRPLRILWNEMIGLLFLVISIPFIWSAIKSFRKIDQGGDNLWGALLSVAFGAVMLFCGIHSFMRARRISRP